MHAIILIENPDLRHPGNKKRPMDGRYMYFEANPLPNMHGHDDVFEMLIPLGMHQPGGVGSICLQPDIV